MDILITGGAGFLGTCLALAMLDQGVLCGQSIGRLVLADRVESRDERLRGDRRVSSIATDLREGAGGLDLPAFDAVFHLASAVSGECEADFDLGLRSNLDVTRTLLDACRYRVDAGAAAPLFFFSSSVAVYGSDPALPMPEVIDDRTLPTPQSSYGIQKFVCEQLLADYTRRGAVDGRAARLMTVAVRPGRPNGAASGFLSGLIREPLAGRTAVCPVSLDTEVAITSPAAAVAGMLAVAQAPRAALAGRTAINLPGLTVTVRDMLDALHRVAGAGALERVRFDPDPAIARLVGGWPSRIDATRARQLGLQADPDFDSVIAQHLRSVG